VAKVVRTYAKGRRATNAEAPTDLPQQQEWDHSKKSKLRAGLVVLIKHNAEHPLCGTSWSHKFSSKMLSTAGAIRPQQRWKVSKTRADGAVLHVL
jgi:hypothetical protein